MTDNYARRFDLGVGSFGGWTICICLLCGGRESISINIVMWECSDFMAYTAVLIFQGLIQHAQTRVLDWSGWPILSTITYL